MFSINRICQLCGLSKITFYRHKHPDERFLEKYEKIKKRIEKIIFDDSSYGVKRIKTALKEDYHLHLGRDALGRLLKLWGLNIRRKIRKPKVSLIKKILISLSDRTNLLIRTKIIRPLQAISSDISEIYYHQGKNKAYLCVHKDVFGQMVYGYDFKREMKTELVLNSFNQALRKIKKLIGQRSKQGLKKILAHQDQGSQYTSHLYVDKVLKGKMILSYSTPGRPTENPGQESFWGRFKDEWQDELREIDSFAKAERFIKKKIKYYNNKRIHTSIGYQCPLKFTKNYLKNNSLIDS